MKRDTESGTGRPERVLLHLARDADEVSGKAIRFRDQQTLIFRSLGELVAWLREGVSAPADPTPADDEPPES